MNNKLILLLLFVCITIPSGLSYQYTTAWDGSEVKWDSNTPNMNASQVSFPSGSPFRTALQWMIQRFNTNPSHFGFNLILDDSGVGYPNLSNEIWFSNDHSGILSNAPAITVYYYLPTVLAFRYRLAETDVILWAGEGYTASTNKTDQISYGGGGRPFQTTSMHEIGHAAGLRHVSNRYNIMGTDFTFMHCNGSQATAYFGTDGTNGLIYLYGKGNSLQDVSLTHWKYAGTSSGEYSVHDRSTITDVNNVELVKHMYNGNDEPRYDVTVGQSFYPHFTIENNGASDSVTMNVGFYLSSDDNITAADRILGGRSNQVFTRGTPYQTFTRDLVLPNDVPTGDYFVGAIVDADNQLAEYDENNNGSYIAIHVTNPNPPTPTPTLTPTRTPRPRPTFSVYIPTYPILRPTPNFRMSIIVNITPSLLSDLDISNQVFIGQPNNKQLVVKWLTDGEIYFEDYLVYLKVDDGKELQYLGRTWSGKANSFAWVPGDSKVDPVFINGPESGHAYQFMLYGLQYDEKSGTDILVGPYEASGPIKYFVEGEMPTPVIEPTPIIVKPTPTPEELLPTPTPGGLPAFEMPVITVEGDAFTINSNDFTQEITFLPETSSFQFQKMEPKFPRYRFGYSSTGMGSASFISLENGSLLSMAQDGNDSSPVILIINPKGKITEFARIHYPDIFVNKIPWRINYVSINGMAFNGKNKLDVILSANITDESGMQYIEASLRSTITGPLNSSSIMNFMIHDGK